MGSMNIAPTKKLKSGPTKRARPPSVRIPLWVCEPEVHGKATARSATTEKLHKVYASVGKKYRTVEKLSYNHL